MKNNIKSWADRSPEERDQIAKNRSLANYNSPYGGKNGAQRERLNQGFMAMR